MLLRRTKTFEHPWSHLMLDVRQHTIVSSPAMRPEAPE
jgi:hypothetical protein